MTVGEFLVRYLGAVLIIGLSLSYWRSRWDAQHPEDESREPERRQP